MIPKELSVPTFVMLTIVGVSTAAAFDIKGVEVGKKMNPANVGKAFDIHCTQLNCHGESTLAGQWANVEVTFETDGTIRSITARFSIDSFGAVRQGLLEKFGTPNSITPRHLQNQLGISFDDEILLWRGTDGSQASLVTHMTSTSSMLWIKSREALQEERGSVAGKDL